MRTKLREITDLLLAPDTILTERYFVRIGLVRKLAPLGAPEKDVVVGAHIGSVHANRSCTYLRDRSDALPGAIIPVAGRIVEILPHCQKCWKEV